MLTHSRQAVDLSKYPELIVIYLGMRARCRICSGGRTSPRPWAARLQARSKNVICTTRNSY